MKDIKFKFETLFLLTCLIGCINSSTETSKQVETEIKYNYLLDSLTTDTLKIQVKTYGCEPTFSEQTAFYKHNDTLFAELSVIGYDKEVLGKLKSFVADTMKNAYANFEKIGKTFENQGPPSTSQRIYIISLNKDSIGFTDTRNEFDGYEKLNNKIFGQLAVDKFRKEIFRRD